MGLTINQTYARIGIERTPSRLDIQSKLPKLELKQKHAKVNIETERVIVEIDQYECFAEAGRKNIADLAKELSSRAYQQVMEFIGKTASDGDTLAAIERGGNPIADICERDAFPEHEFGLDTIPKSRPKYNVKGGVKILPERNGEGVNNGVEGNYIPGNVDINYTPAKIRVYMEQYPSVDIRYTGNTVDTRV